MKRVYAFGGRHRDNKYKWQIFTAETNGTSVGDPVQTPVTKERPGQEQRTDVSDVSRKQSRCHPGTHGTRVPPSPLIFHGRAWHAGPPSVRAEPD